MASGEMDDLCEQFNKFALIEGNDQKMFTLKASRKLVADCWDKEYNTYHVKSIVEDIVFPELKEAGAQGMPINGDNCKMYISKTAHELAKRKTNNIHIADDDVEWIQIQERLRALLSDPVV